VNPDDGNDSLGLTGKETQPSAPKAQTSTPAPSPTPPPAAPDSTGDLSTVDANGNGKVTIQEVRDAGYSMPIYKDHWLYQYMDDRDGDGMVGE